MQDADKLGSSQFDKNSDDLIKIEPMVIVETDLAPTKDAASSFSKLTLRQWAIIGMLACANFFSTIAFSCIAPFFPGEAQKKDLSTTEVGIIFGVFELVMLVVSPLLGKYVSHF